MTERSTDDVPRRARRFLAEVQAHERELRAAQKLRYEMYAGEGMQWDPAERSRRQAGPARPMLEINECKPPVDQIETSIRLNPPGPICHPVGGGADAETADVIAGIIRQTLHASNGARCGVAAGRACAISGYGVIEYCTRFADDNSLDQELAMVDNPDPMRWYFDPLAVLPNREDALRAMKGPRILSREAFEQEYGKRCKVLDRNYRRAFVGGVQGMFGWAGDAASINTWTSGGDGPYWVAEYWEVEIKLATKRMYTDNIFRFDSDAKKLPPGVKPKTDADGDTRAYEREIPRRRVFKYVVDACETRDKTEFIGDHIPALAVLGPETYIEGKLYRGSLVAGMMDAQKALNFTATSMMEIAGKMPKAPYIGHKGQFDDLDDAGRNKWVHANTTDYPYLQVEPVQLVDETTGRVSLAPLPQRNLMEAPIQWCLALASFFKDAIQAASAYSATSLGKRTADQSGEAIRALQAESSAGTFSYPDGVNSAYSVMFQQWLEILPKIMDEARAATIIAADGQNERKLINQDFPHPAGGKNADGTPRTMAHNIALGRYSVRVDAGPSPETRNLQAQGSLANLFKAAPELLQIPGVAAAYCRMLGDGNPKTDQIADMLPGGAGDTPNPAAMQGQLQQAQQRIQQLTAGLTQMSQAIQAKLPQIEADKWKAALAGLVNIRVAEIGAGVDHAQIDADTLEHLTGMAHDVATQAVDQAHQVSQQASSQQASADAATQAQQATTAQATAEPAPPAGDQNG